MGAASYAKLAVESGEAVTWWIGWMLSISVAMTQSSAALWMVSWFGRYDASKGPKSIQSSLPALKVWAKFPVLPGQLFNTLCDFRILNQRWCMLWFDAGVDDQGTLATPMFIDNLGTDTMNVAGRIAASKNGPKKIVQCAGTEFGIVHHQDQRETIDGMFDVQWL